MLSFCLRALLYCFTFIKTHAIWFLLLHIVYAIWITKYINNMYNTKIKAYLMLPEKLRKWPFCRKECHKIKKWKLILGGIFLLPWRLLGSLIILLFGLFSCLIITAGLDPEKPYPK